MVSKPAQWISDIAAAGGNRFTFHLEVSSPPPSSYTHARVHIHHTYTYTTHTACIHTCIHTHTCSHVHTYKNTNPFSLIPTPSHPQTQTHTPTNTPPTHTHKPTQPRPHLHLATVATGRSTVNMGTYHNPAFPQGFEREGGQAVNTQPQPRLPQGFEREGWPGCKHAFIELVVAMFLTKIIMGFSVVVQLWACAACVPCQVAMVECGTGPTILVPIDLPLVLRVPAIP